MKITFLSPTLALHGGTLCLAKYANYLVQRGHEVSIIAAHSEIEVPLSPKIRVNTYQPTKIPYCDTLTFQRLLTKRIIPLIQKEAPDILIPIYTPLLLAAVRAKQSLSHMRIIFFGQDASNMIWVGKYNQWLLRQPTIHTSLSHIVAVSDALSESYRRLTPTPVTVIANGIEHETFYPETVTKEFFLLFVGRPGPQKGFPTFKHAYSLVKKHIPSLSVKVIAPGLKETSNEGIEYVAFRSKEQLAKLYRHAILYVNASPAESFGLPPLEAMACGTAVVLTETEGSSMYAKNNQNCLVVPPNYPRLLAHAISKVITDHHLRNHLEACGQETAKQFTWEKACREFHKVLSQTTERG